jgi:hypothetical protein
MTRKSGYRFSGNGMRPQEPIVSAAGRMIRKLILAALVALVAAPVAALWQAGPAGFETPRFDLGGVRQVSIGSLASTGLL